MTNGPLRIKNGPLRKKRMVHFIKIMKWDILRTKTPITKPILTFDKKKNKSMLKSGIPDMIPEKNILLVIDPLRIDFKKVYKSVMNN